MKRLIVFGDSFSSTNYCVDVDCSFYGLMAQQLEIDQIINYSWLGNDVTTIKHLVVNEIDQFDPANDYIFVGIPPLERVTVYDQDNADDRNYSRTIVDRNWKINTQKIERLQGTMTGPITSMIPGYISLYNRSWTEAMALTDIQLLHGYLLMKGYRFIIGNLGQPITSDTQWNTLHTLIHKTCQLDNVVVFDNTYYSVNYQKNMPVDYDRYGWFGHHGPAGNELWYRLTLHPLMQKLKWA